MKPDKQMNEEKPNHVLGLLVLIASCYGLYYAIKLLLL